MNNPNQQNDENERKDKLLQQLFEDDLLTNEEVEELKDSSAAKKYKNKALSLFNKRVALNVVLELSKKGIKNNDYHFSDLNLF